MKKILLLFAVLLSVTAWAAAPKVVAHRGHHRADGSAQNSIRSLVKADSIGADATEFDVWLSADSVLYVNHNADINKMVIETSGGDSLAGQRLNNGEIIPRLDTFLDTAATLGIDLVLELKAHRDSTREDIAVPMIIRMVAERGLTDRVTYITFSRHAFRLFVEQSGRPVQFLSAMDPDELARRGGAGGDYNISVFRKHPEWIGRLHELGKDVNIWTVDKEEDIQWCIDNGADYITTNEPELTMRLIRDAGQKK